MPVQRREDSKGVYYQWGSQKKYYVSEYGEEKAKNLAEKQGQAIHIQEENHMDDLREENVNKKTENITSTNNGYFEICEISNEDVSGRVKIKMSSHFIHPDRNQWNKNGITWLEEYTQANIKSAIGMNYVVDWLIEEEQIPSGHGQRSYDEEGNVQFEGVVVGSVLDANITEVEIDGEIKKVMMTEGYINSQRYPKFVKWLREQVKIGKVYGSIEINGKGKNKKIEYLDGNKNSDGSLKMGRVPTVFDFSGLAILYLEEPADENSQVFEVNSKIKDIDLDIENSKNEGGSIDMEYKEKYEAMKADYEKMQKDYEVMQKKMEEINQSMEKNKKEEISQKIEELNSKLEKSEKELTEAKEVIVNANKQFEETKSNLDKANEEINTLKAENEKFKTEKLQTEVNSYFENEIKKNGFDESEINSLKGYVEKIDLEGLKKAEIELCAKKFKELATKEQESEVNSENKFISTKQETEENIKATKIPTFFK